MSYAQNNQKRIDRFFVHFSPNLKLAIAEAGGIVDLISCGFGRKLNGKSMIRTDSAKAVRNCLIFFNSAKAFLNFQSGRLSEATGNLSIGGGVLRRGRALCMASSRLISGLQTLKIFPVAIAFLIIFSQTNTAQTTDSEASNPKAPSSTQKYLDHNSGKTADEVVALALVNNDELEAIRKEVEASQAMIKQAKLRANPMLEFGAAKNPATPANSLMVKGALPLELFGRRGARVKVAEKEADVRRQDLLNRERLLAAEVRAKFGESLAMILKLQFIEETLVLATENYELISARVREGKNAPLEQNMESVELNRIRSMREANEGKVEIALLELRNLIGYSPQDQLILQGDFEGLLEPLTPQIIATEQALAQRPDLQTARAFAILVDAKIDQARIQGKPDASFSAGYERMRQGFPQRGFDEVGNLTPIMELANVFSVGLTLNLPVFDKNQGMIEAAVLEKSAALKRVEFGELTVRREVAAGYAKYLRSSRAMEIFRVGVEQQAQVNLGVVRQTYEFGKQSLLDYISEQRRYIEIKEEFIDTQLETYLARVDILSATSSPELIKK